MTVVSATLLIPLVLIFHFLLAALYLAQSSRHPSCPHSCLILYIVPSFFLSVPLLAWYGVGEGASIRSSSLSPAVTYTLIASSGVAPLGWHVIVSTGVVATCPRWVTAAERAEPLTSCNSTSCSPLINAARWSVGWHTACHSNHSRKGQITGGICRPARWFLFESKRSLILIN